MSFLEAVRSDGLLVSRPARIDEHRVSDRNTFLDWKKATSDPLLLRKLSTLPEIIESWIAPYGGFSGREVLDFGCGFGETAAGIALQYDVTRVVGVDVQDKPARCEPLLMEKIGIGGLPDHLTLAQIEKGALLGEQEFDLVISWSVLEHVQRDSLRQTIADLWTALRPGGLAFVQISPLYFSPEGSHLWAIGYGGWEHLLRQTSEVLADIEAAPHLTTEAKDRLVRLYSTLNRVTANELTAHCDAVGFEVVRQQRDRTEKTPSACLTEAYCVEALTTDQIVLLLKKPDLSNEGHPHPSNQA
ncbi:SAM-dependent methyltransferase [Brevundimonas sp. SL161]|uniref:SAM-dependent methyltransferase n=1 Tax=Brevundimonas sp. SL161 TaxID=2804613 RepID=UPI003CE75301